MHDPLFFTKRGDRKRLALDNYLQHQELQNASRSAHIYSEVAKHLTEKPITLGESNNFVKYC
jgi:hypothetical protein